MDGQKAIRVYAAGDQLDEGSILYENESHNIACLVNWSEITVR